jgi:hypothetical protein
MNAKMKAMLASYLRSFLASGLTAYQLGDKDWKAVLAAGLSAVVPVAIRALNKKDPAFGMVADFAEVEIDKLAKADTKKASKKAVK